MAQNSFLPLDPPAADRCGESVHVDASGHVVADPWAVLGLDPSARPDADAVRAAFVQQIQAHPPERDPEGALRVREARDRLTDPGRLFERIVGVLHVPDASAWGLPTDASAIATPGAADGGERLDARTRIYGQAVAYCLIEDSIIKAQSGG